MLAPRVPDAHTYELLMNAAQSMSHYGSEPRCSNKAMSAEPCNHVAQSDSFKLATTATHSSAADSGSSPFVHRSR